MRETAEGRRGTAFVFFLLPRMISCLFILPFRDAADCSLPSKFISITGAQRLGVWSSCTWRMELNAQGAKKGQQRPISQLIRPANQRSLEAQLKTPRQPRTGQDRTQTSSQLGIEECSRFCGCGVVVLCSLHLELQPGLGLFEKRQVVSFGSDSYARLLLCVVSSRRPPQIRLCLFVLSVATEH